jgi:tight adherence protein C
MNVFLIIPVLVVVLAIILVVVGMKAREPTDPIQARLKDIGEREVPMTLEEIELSQGFYDRIILPFFNRIGQIASRFTPQATLQTARRKLEMAGNPMRMDPAFFLAMRSVIAVLFGGVLIFVFVMSKRNWAQGLALTAAFTVLGFYFPDLWLSSRIKRRQKGVFRAMPDALDLLTICVEAGLGFDAAMAKIYEKWPNDLGMAFGRVVREIQLGKLRREALRDMADRLGIPEMTSFVAAVIQSEQLGVSMAQVLRIQSDQMRVKRRQLAEEEAHKAPIKMLLPMAGLIFPALCIVIMVPAALRLINSGAMAIFGG